MQKAFCRHFGHLAHFENLWRHSVPAHGLQVNGTGELPGASWQVAGLLVDIGARWCCRTGACRWLGGWRQRFVRFAVFFLAAAFAIRGRR